MVLQYSSMRILALEFHNNSIPKLIKLCCNTIISLVPISSFVRIPSSFLNYKFSSIL